MAEKYRIEHDLLGERQVPAGAYFGIHTLRAFENFPISGNPISIYPDLIRALACIKQAAAVTNHDLGLLDQKRADAIVEACKEIRAGRAARALCRRRHPGRRGHLDQHERQRGHRQPRASSCSATSAGNTSICTPTSTST